MRDQSGVTLLEVVIAVAILALVSGLATLAGVGFLNSSKTSKARTEFADSVSLTRESAIARYERWRIRFIPHPVAGSGIIRTYVLESCPLPVGNPGTACTDDLEWTEQQRVHLAPGIGLVTTVTTITFDRTGRFMDSDSNFEICPVIKNEDNSEVCRTGPHARTVRIRQFSGIIES